MSNITNAELKALNEAGFFNRKFSDAQPAPFTTINTNMPAGILTTLSSNVVENILARRTADEALGGREKLMNWEDEAYFLPFVEKAGQTAPYADNSTPLAVSMNASFNQVGHYRFTSSFTFGDLQAAQFSKAKINYSDVLLRSSTEAIAVELNRTAFNGYIDNSGKAMLCYGLLNNPDLGEYKSETTDFAAMTWEQVMAFFAKAIKALIEQTQNNINGQSKIRVVIASSAFAELQAKFTSLGISVYEKIKATYPSMEFVPAIELDGVVNDTDNAIYFIGESNIGGIDKTTTIGYSEIALMGNVVQSHYGYSQAISAGTCGALVFKPAFVVRYSGI